MKKNYFVVSISRNNKRAAYVKAISENYNLAGMFPEDSETITLMPTKKKAIETAETWNKVWADEGRMLYEDHLKFGAPIVENALCYWE